MDQLIKNERSSVTPEVSPNPSEARKQRVRSIAIALGLGFLVLLFYLATIVRLGGNVLNRPI